ncbi:hypothetical protein RUE5091_00046 [Ruegeria denitrificans]|uniref:Uncharacterized protein n=1 Tax=Ruegeria denitrificans TaxID=1715692 RepID=A0A0P1I0G9_9RHOB|nr:hypothetical protein RUE5091_00046 [Ruegeria denitrificans]
MRLRSGLPSPNTMADAPVKLRKIWLLALRGSGTLKPTGSGWPTMSSTEDHPDNQPSAALSGLPGDVFFAFFLPKSTLA